MSGYETATGDQFSVGGTPNKGVILSKDAQEWTAQHELDEMLHWIHGADDVMWAVGAKGTFLKMSTNGAIIPQMGRVPIATYGVFGHFRSKTSGLSVVMRVRQAVPLPSSCIMMEKSGRRSRFPN